MQKLVWINYKLWILIMCFTNLIQINATDTTTTCTGPGTERSLNNKPWLMPYDPNVLKTICMNIDHDIHYKCLPFGSISRIRELQLNRRLTCKHLGRHTDCRWLRPGVNFDNLMQVEIHAPDGSLHETQLVIATLNTQSI